MLYTAQMNHKASPRAKSKKLTEISKSDNALLKSIGSESKNLRSIKRDMSGSMGQLRSQVHKLQDQGLIQITEDEEHLICRLSRSGKKQLKRQNKQEE